MADTSATEVHLTAPLNGWVAALDEVPDPVFSGRMLGDGIAIDPLDTILRAPCDGVVISLHAGGHAVTLRSPEGAEILLHIGIDTVGQGGKGFDPKVAVDAVVKRGDPLIAFDLDALLPLVPAMITPMLITNGDAFVIEHRAVNAAVDIGDEVMVLTPKAATLTGMSAATATAGDETVTRTIIVPLAHGIHARPAARIADAARRFDAKVSIAKHDRSVSAASPVALLTLGIARGDTIEVAATGAGAAAALDTICELIDSGMGEKVAVASAATGRPAAPLPFVAAPAVADGMIHGVSAAPGRVVGIARWLKSADRDVTERAADPDVERDRLDRAIAEAGRRLEAIGGAGAASILDAHRGILADPALRADADHAIAKGYSADWAWRQALRPQADALRGMADPRLAERADDLLDVERQVLAALAGEEPGGEGTFAPDTVLLAEDLLPSQLARIGAGGIAGLCTMRGGPTSHVAILAAGMAIPAVVAVGPLLEGVTEGAAVILDANAALLDPAPSKAVLDTARAGIPAEQERKAEAAARAHEAAVTRDGQQIDVFANLGSHDDAVRAVAAGAEGSGLLRTEFLFLDRPDAPDEDEQAAEYQRIASALDGRPLVVRLLDIGGDKPAPYLPLPAEENPALGLRGIRVGFAYPELLKAQLRAILRVQPLGQCRIMVPMVASPAELMAVRGAFDEARAALGIDAAIELGAMIETPAAAICADSIAAHADFLSIGTNDLTQYVLAMDRGNPTVAAGIDALHPAVLRMIDLTVSGGQAHGRSTSVCGGLASDPLAVPLLIGLGVTELSAAPAMAPEIKAAVRDVSLDDCRALARTALALTSAAEVRTLAQRFRAEREGKA